MGISINHTNQHVFMVNTTQEVVSPTVVVSIVKLETM